MQTGKYQWHGICLSYFSYCYDKISQKKQLKEGRVYCGSQFKTTVHHGGEGPVVRTCVTLCLQSRSREQWIHVQFSLSPDYSQGSQPRQWYHLQWVDLPTSTNLIKIISYKYTQAPISQMTSLDVTKLTDEINHHWKLKQCTNTKTSV